MSIFGPGQIWPRANRFEIHYCGHCANAHVIYFDESDLVRGNNKPRTGGSSRCF